MMVRPTHSEIDISEAAYTAEEMKALLENA